MLVRERNRPGVAVSLVVAVGLASPPMFAQLSPSIAPLATRTADLNVLSGQIAAPSATPDGGAVVVYTTLVRVPEARWVQLQFAPSTSLAGDPATTGAVLRLTSLLDGGMQLLNAEHLALAHHSSAFFNGDSVLVELIASPGTGASEVNIAFASADEPPQGPFGFGNRTICGATDDRVLSSDPRQGRLLGSGCTAWLFDDANRTFLTAGHCGPTAASYVEFNVPLSSGTGALLHPPPSDQYFVDATSVQLVNGGIGNDFCYFGVLPNSTTGLVAFTRQNAAYSLIPGAPTASGQTLRITGYGTTSAPVSLTWNQVQKTHTGPLNAISGTALQYSVDTTGGNSGSPVVEEVAGRAIGIHTHGGCTSAGGVNSGTSAALPALRGALAAPRGICRSGLGTPGGPIFAAADMNGTVGTLDTTTGNFAGVRRFGPAMYALAYSVQLRSFVATAREGTQQRLYLIDPATGVASARGTLTGLAPTQILTGLACLTGTRPRLLGLSGSDGVLVAIDPYSFAATPIGGSLAGVWSGLEYDPSRHALFALENTGGPRLFRVDASTGAKTLVGSLVVAGRGSALAFDERDRMLYTIEQTSATLIRINPGTGVGTAVGPANAMFGVNFEMAGVLSSSPEGCVADFDGDGGVTIEDLLGYLDAFTSGLPPADIDDGSATGRLDLAVTLDDLLFFLTRLDAGC